MDKKLDHQSSDDSGYDQTAASDSVAAILLKLGVSLGIIAASIVAFLTLGKSESPARRAPPKPSGIAVTSSPVRVHQGVVSIEASGVVVPYRDLSIAAEVSGRIVFQTENLRAGLQVSKGETLIRIDSTEYDLEVRRLDSLHGQAQAELDALAVAVENTNSLFALASEELQLQRTEMRRIESLRARDASSESEIESAKRAELAARSNLVRVENELRNLAAQKTLLEQKRNLTAVELERAQLNQARTSIVSPVDGIVAQCMVEEQSYVSPGQTFARIEDMSAMEVRCNLTMDEMNWLWSHRKESSPISGIAECEIGGRRHQWYAEFERVDGTGVDDNTRTIPCLFRVNQRDSISRLSDEEPAIDDPKQPQPMIRGMFVSLRIETSPDRELFRVPSQAIRPGKRVWLNDHGLLRIANVTIVSLASNEMVIESSEIAANDQVITSPVPGAREGLQLSIGNDGALRGSSGGMPGKAKTDLRNRETES